jgi:hypothetical protein
MESKLTDAMGPRARQATRGPSTPRAGSLAVLMLAAALVGGPRAAQAQVLGQGIDISHCTTAPGSGPGYINREAVQCWVGSGASAASSSAPGSWRRSGAPARRARAFAPTASSSWRRCGRPCARTASATVDLYVWLHWPAGRPASGPPCATRCGRHQPPARARGRIPAVAVQAVGRRTSLARSGGPALRAVRGGHHRPHPGGPRRVRGRPRRPVAAVLPVRHLHAQELVAEPHGRHDRLLHVSALVRPVRLRGRLQRLVRPAVPVAGTVRRLDRPGGEAVLRRLPGTPVRGRRGLRPHDARRPGRPGDADRAGVRPGHRALQRRPDVGPGRRRPRQGAREVPGHRQYQDNVVEYSANSNRS